MLYTSCPFIGGFPGVSNCFLSQSNDLTPKYFFAPTFPDAPFQIWNHELLSPLALHRLPPSGEFRTFLPMTDTFPSPFQFWSVHVLQASQGASSHADELTEAELMFDPHTTSIPDDSLHANLVIHQMKCYFPPGENVCKRCRSGKHECIIEGRKPRSAPK